MNGLPVSSSARQNAMAKAPGMAETLQSGGALSVFVSDHSVNEAMRPIAAAFRIELESASRISKFNSVEASVNPTQRRCVPKRKRKDPPKVSPIK